MNKNPALATTISFKAQDGAAPKLAALLTGAGDLVRDTEPGTLQWFAFERDGVFTVVDTFQDEDGRAAHFAGKVAAALCGVADELVEGGWDAVLAAVQHHAVLSTNLTAA